MSDTIRKTVELISLIRRFPRVTVVRAGQETGMSVRSVYRYMAHLSRVMPVRIEQGVIIRCDDEDN